MKSTPATDLLAVQQHLNARRFAQTEQLAREILRRDRRNGEAMQFLAMALFLTGRPAEAIPWLQKSLEVQPTRAEFHGNLGMVLCATGEYRKGAEHHRRSVELNPRNAVFLTNLGQARLATGDYSGAADVCRQASALAPAHGPAYNNLALALVNLGDLDAAVPAARRAAELMPAEPAAWSTLVQALEEAGELEDAITAARRGASLGVADDVGASNLLMTTLYSASHVPEEVAEAHRAWGRRYAEAAPKVSPSTDPSLRWPARGGRLRVGYVSGDFRRHPVASFFAPVLLNHDRTRFEIFCYASAAAEDDITLRFRAASDHWRNITELSDDAAATTIAADGVDVLVDLSGHTANSRLLVFARRPAPLQMTYLGYPATTGMRELDCFLTDEMLDPPGDDRLYTERLIRLPGGFCAYEPHADAPPVADRPDGAASGVTFISQHPLIRLTADVIGLWSRVLAAVPGSRMLLARNDWTTAALDRVARQFAQAGIDPARIELRRFARPTHHLSNYNDADVMLDTFPWSGHTAACESLWMGCPVVTLYGASHVGRRVASVLHQIGLDDLIARSKEEYVAKAAALAADAARRRDLRLTLRDRMKASPLMDGARLARAIESAYIEAVSAAPR